MPETEKKLVLHSPAGSEHVEYRWPLSRTDTWDEAVEIVETIRWVCRDFPELKLAVEKFVLNSFEPTSYESMKQLCERYNRAVDNIRKLWSGRQPPPGIDAPPSIPLLRHIINQSYNRAVTNPEDLNSYEPFSPEVYGETSFELISEVIKHSKMTENDVFIDLGSGIGQVVLQVTAQVGCKCYGIEKADIPAKYAERMEEEFVHWIEWYGKSYGEFQLLKGDFLDTESSDILQSSTVIFTNNFAFGPKLNHELKLKFANLKDGTKIISSHEFCPLNFRITPRNLSDIGSIMHVAELSPLKGNVSWTGKPVSYYLHVLDRGKLEKFFLRQKHPDEYKSESSGHSTSGSSDDSSDSSSSESHDDQFENALRKIKLTGHPRPPKKLHQYHQPPVPNSKPAAIQRKMTAKQRSSHKTSQRGSQEPLKLKSNSHKEYDSCNASSAMASPNLLEMDALFSSFQHQLEVYMRQLSTPGFQGWVTDAIEKEKMKKSHLQGVIRHLESEVTGLARETVDQMKENMKELGIAKMTPDGLLLGAKSIVSQNKQLRKEMTDLEKEISSLREQNKLMEAMCTQPSKDSQGKMRSLSQPEGEVVTNGIVSPHHTGAPELENGNGLRLGLIALTSFLVERERAAAVIDPHTANLLKQYGLDLEKIDQKLLELGPYAQDAYPEGQLSVAGDLPIVSPVDLKRGKRMKPLAQGRVPRHLSRAGEEFLDGQRGGWREVGEVKQEEKMEKEVPKKKWRKVGSASPLVRGKEGQLDAESDPLNVSSACVIQPASEVEMRALYLPTQSEFGASEHNKSNSPASRVAADVEHRATPAQNTSKQVPTSATSKLSEPPLELDRTSPVHALPSHPTSTSVATPAPSTPDCNTSTPSETPDLPRTQPSAQWVPQTAKFPPGSRQDILATALGHHPQQVSVESAGASEEVDVTRVENTETQSHQLTAAQAERVQLLSSDFQALQKGYASSNHPRSRKDLPVSKSISPPTLTEVLTASQEAHRTSSPSAVNPSHRLLETNHIPEALTQPLGAGNVVRSPGFSIAQLTRGPDTSAMSPSHEVPSPQDHMRGGGIQVGGEWIVLPPQDIESSLHKRRSSSSSSHRSMKHHFEDSSSVRSASPLSTPTPRNQHMPLLIRGEWVEGGTGTPPPQENKPPAPQPSPVPFPMWPNMPQMPNDNSLPGQPQRFPVHTPFLPASGPWFRTGMLPGMSFRPALYPTAAAATNPLDPNNPYKSMLSMPYYPFTPAGLKAPFPNPSFTSSSLVVQGSQPQTPSSVPPTQGFTFGQYPIPTGPGVTPLRGMTDAQGRLSAATLPLGQHPSLNSNKESKLIPGSLDSPQDQQQQQQPWPLLHGMQLFQGTFGFGMQSPLTSSVNQSSLLGARGAMAFSSPLTLASQSIAPASVSERDSAAVKRPRKQSASTIDLTTHGDYVTKHIEAPSPQEAVKMATQKMSPLHEQMREASKWRSIQESMQAPSSSSSSSSPLVPAFINNIAVSAGSSSQAQGPVMSYSMLGAPGTGAAPMNLQGHLLNSSQLVGVALPGGHMVPMGYTPTLSSFGAKVEEGGKKRSPKGSGSQKLRIHQMDFKSQGKVDRRRRRPWRAAEKDRKEEDLNASALNSSKTKPAGESPMAVANPSQSAPSEDNYALNMLADCSSKEGEKTMSGEETSTSGQKQEMVAKRAHMRSPGSLAGANSLLLLAKPDSPALPTTLPLRVTPPETAVVDGLLRLSNSSLPNPSSGPQDAALLPTVSNIAVNSEKDTAPDSRGRLNSMSAAEAILMIGQYGANAGEIKREVPSKEEVSITQEPVLSADTSTKDQAANDERNEVYSEKTDTDSEATLTPTSPSPSISRQWAQEAPFPHALMEEGSPQGISAQTPDALGQVCPKKVTTSLGTSPSSSPLTRETSDCKDIVSSWSGVVASPQTTDKKSQEIPENREEALGQRPENPQLEDSTVKKWNCDVNAFQFVRRDATESDVVSTVRREGLLGVGSFPTTISPAKEEESYDLDVEEVETEPEDTLKPNNKSTGVTISSQQEAQDYSSSDRSLPQNELAREDVVLSAPSPLPRLLVAPAAVGNTAQSEVEELPGETAQEETEGQEQLSVDLIPPTKRAKVEEPSYQPPPEEEMDINTASALQSPVKETGADPSLPEPASPPSSDLPSGNAELSTPQTVPDIPSPTDLKQPETDTTHAKQETSPIMDCNSQDDPIEERSGSYPVEQLSPTGFTENCISGAPDGKETRPESEGTSSEVTKMVCNSPSGTGDIASPNNTSTTPEEDSPQLAPPNISNHQDVADISWPSDPEEGEDNTTEIGTVLSQNDEAAISITTPKNPPAASEHISLTDGSLQTTTLKVTSKSPPFSTSSEKHTSSRATNRKSPRPSTVEHSIATSVAGPVNSVRKSSPPVAPQNRLPIGKSGFDRHQHRKVLSQHSQKQHLREENNTQTKKWSRGLESPSRPWNLFDVDPQDARRQPKTENREQSDHSEILSQDRKTKLTSRAPISSHVIHSHAGNKLSTERSKHGSRSPRSFASEESVHRHNRLQEGRGHVWESREVSKQKVRPAGRQCSRFSPLPPSHVELSPGSPLVSDEEQSRNGRNKVHQNLHGWRDEHQSQAEHARDRTHTQSKHKSSHRGDSKQGTDHAGRKVRVEKEKNHGPSEQRKAPPAPLETNHSDGGSVSGGYRRHREDDDHSSSRLKVATVRKRSYESVSDDELPEELNRSSSRESSLLREEGSRLERRSSLEMVGEQRSSQWRKDHRRSADPPDNAEDYARTVKHKKHRHSKDHKEYKERRKWRKTEGSDHKLKRNSEEKPWHSYHKH